jgi:hypothetical protein
MPRFYSYTRVYDRSMLTLILWVFVLFITLSYFGVSVESIINNPTVQANIAYVIHYFSQFFNK